MPPKKKKKASSPQKKKDTSLFYTLCRYAFLAFLWGGLILGIYIAWVAAELPGITADVKFERKRAITFLANDGSVLVQIGELKGETVDVKDLPPHLIHALLATEDRRFYEHFGIDPLGIGRAMLVNLRHGRFVQGGSTLTQQLAKNLFLTRERTIKRKVQEALLSLWLENTLTKDDILTAYLNRVYFGSGAYGIEAASQLYYSKPATQLTVNEAALLVGLLKAPSRYSPLNNPELSRERQSVVIAAMKDAGYDYTSSGEPDIYSQSQSIQHLDKRQIYYFTDWLMDQVQVKVGAIETDLIVTTTLSPSLQSKSENALSTTLQNYGEEKNIGQGAIIVFENTGALRAMVGGRSYQESQFNRATQALRPPGSAFKPFVFLTATSRGWDIHDTILDAPMTEGTYRPGNFGDKYMGDVSLRQALTYSLNTATVRLADQIGSIGYLIGTARKLGITSHLNRNQSLALGSSGVSLLEMTSAYTVFPNEGRRPDPYAILEIKDKEENIYYEHEPQYPPQLFDEDAVEAVASAMSDVITDGTGRAANINTSGSGGKTGTSQDFRDAWFIGFTPGYTAGIWLGNDDNSPMNQVTGGSYPAQIWKSLMQDAPRGRTISRSGQGSSFSRMLSDLLSGSSPQSIPENDDKTHQHHDDVEYNR
jgi:penicillin-binding protein 1A